LIVSALNIKKSDCSVISGFIKKNIVIILSVFSFAVISYDLTTESVVEDYEIEFCNALLKNAANPSKQKAVPSISRTEEKTIAGFTSNKSELILSEVSRKIQKRPPPLCITI